MTILTALAFSGLLLVGLQDPVTDPVPDPSRSPTSSAIELLEQLKNPDRKIQQEALQTILIRPDPALLPGLMAILNDPDPGLRRQITLLVLRAYPDHCFKFFQEALGGLGTPRREAAAYGLGLIDDPRVVALLEAAAVDPDSTVQMAALRGLQSLIRAQLPVIFRRVSGNHIDTATSSSSTARSALSVLNRLAQAQPHNNNLQAARLRCLDPEFAAQNRNHWLENLALPDHRLQQLRGIFATNQSWLGRTTPPKPLRYQFSMFNLVSGSSKGISIDANVSDIATLRALDYDLDRVIHLRIASDLWFNIPDALEPEIEFSENHVDISFKIERFPLRHAGIGLLNISYWESKISGGAALLRFDAKSFRLIEETIHDADGKTIWKLTVPAWFEEITTMPQQINIDIPGGRVGAKLAHLKLTLKFQHKASQWLLARAKTVEITTQGEQDRAYCEVELLPSAAAEPAAGGAGSDKSSSPPGSADDSDSGQGSSAGSPRK
ncbi:MAG: HEAT repeat domain-containing protein [Planctomycetota bacterium]